MEPALAVSVIAVLVTVLFALRGERTSKRVTAIEEARRLEEVLLQKTADVTARIDRERYTDTIFDKQQSRNNYYFVIHNRGHAPATNVTATVGDADGSFNKQLAERFPLSYLDSGAELSTLLFVPTNLFSQPHIAHLEWTDERGKHSKDVPLSLA